MPEGQNLQGQNCTMNSWTGTVLSIMLCSDIYRAEMTLVEDLLLTLELHIA